VLKQRWAQKKMTLFMFLCTVVGLSCLTPVFWIEAKAYVGQVLIENAWQKSLEKKEFRKPWPWADTYPVARLSIQSQDQTLYVLAGDSGEALAFAPSMTTHTSFRGQTIYLMQAHNDTHFTFLESLEDGDQLVLEQLSKTDVFTVAEKRLLKKPQLMISDELDTAMLLLTSCHLAQNDEVGHQKRFVVAAYPSGALLRSKMPISDSTIKEQE
jgi:sortase A